MDFTPEALRQYFIDTAPKTEQWAALMKYIATGTFTDAYGRDDVVGRGTIQAAQVHLIHYLVRKSKATLTVETGFGGGASALTFILSKAATPDAHHYSIDPFGLNNKRGFIVRSHIQETYWQSFTLLRERSEFALPALAQKHAGQVRLSFIDGGHWPEQALVDFVYLDMMTPVGGFIVLDDVMAPGMEMVARQIIANRSDYIAHEECPNSVVFERVDADRRRWDHFRPFDCPQRTDWNLRSDKDRIQTK